MKDINQNQDEDREESQTNKINPWIGDCPAPVKECPYSPEAHGYQHLKGTPDPLPLEKPPFTLRELRDAIPPHCFERSTIKALFYTFHNVSVCLILLYSATWIQHLNFYFHFPYWLTWILWPLYWFLQGSYMFGLWILAHECGHEAYSKYPLLNNTVGLILHSFLLVPYHSWRISHHKHHMHTGSAEDEEVHVPRTRSYVENIWIEILVESPLINFFGLTVMFIGGLLPLYLVFNWTGPLKYKGKNANHFSPNAVFFLPKQRNDVIVSDIVYFSWILLLFYWCHQYGFSNMFFYYGVPQLITNFHLAVVTYLQHTDTFVPHFRSQDWYWLRGALCTVDRSFGKWLDGVFHHISDTHVCHHLFPKLPFYHAEEATSALTKILGKYRLVDETPILKALWRAYRNCKFVEDDGPVVFYKRSIKSKVL